MYTDSVLWRTGDSRMQPADDDPRVFSCSCCDSPLPADKWTTDDDDDDDEEKSSSDSRQSVDSTANWYQQQIVDSKQTTVSGDFRHSRMTTSHPQDAQPAAVFNCDSTVVGSSVIPAI